MKKALTLLLTLVLILSFFVGCTGTPDVTSAETGTDKTTATEAVTEPASETEEETTAEPETTGAPETEAVTYGEFKVEPDETAELTVSNVFGNSMVLQRDETITVWGTSNKDGATVRGLFMGDEARGEVVDGKWEITFSGKEASAEPQTMTIEDTCGCSVTIEDILIGDVWIIGGQSNAEATAVHIPQAATDIKIDPDKLIRILHQSADDVIAKKSEAKEPRDTLINPKRKWAKITRLNSSSVTLLGMFFGQRLADEAGVPIGIISVAANGAKINELMPAELAAKFKYKIGGNVGVSGYYNGLVHPFTRIKFKAMVFFQGESEAFVGANPPAKNYSRDVEALFTEYRTIWGFEFPIYNIQLSDYTSKSASGSADTGIVRAQQYDAYKNMTNVRLIPSYDLGAEEGNLNYMHSKRKKELAERVAALALADIYGKGSPDDALAPEPVEVKLSEDNTYVTVKFKNVGVGLVSKCEDGKVGGFAIGQITQKKRFLDAEAEIISNDTVKVMIPEGAKLTGIGYCCSAHVTTESASLFNSFELPALAFYCKFE